MFTYLFKKLSLSRKFGICIFNILSDLSRRDSYGSALVAKIYPERDLYVMNNPG